MTIYAHISVVRSRPYKHSQVGRTVTLEEFNKLVSEKYDYFLGFIHNIVKGIDENDAKDILSKAVAFGRQAKTGKPHLSVRCLHMRDLLAPSAAFSSTLLFASWILFWFRLVVTQARQNGTGKVVGRRRRFRD